MGDSAEKLFFDDSVWKFDGANRTAYHSKNSNQKIAIARSFPFRSDFKRMSNIVRISGHESYFNGTYVVSKGAPEVLSKHFREIPQDYNINSQGYMKDGYRVMALAYRKLTKVELEKGENKLTREEVEKD